MATELSLADLDVGLVDTRWFSPVTRPWIARLVEEIDGNPSGDSIVRAETAALLFFVLRQQPDSVFPGGKWATIQHLEGQIDTAVAEALRR